MQTPSTATFQPQAAPPGAAADWTIPQRWSQYTPADHAILAQAERSETAVVLGASFIGMEVAASLRERGLGVTVVGMEAAPFEKQLGARIGNAFVGLHQKRGVNFRLGQQIEALEGERTVHTVRLKSSERLPADLVVIGFGVKPVTAYLHGVPLNQDGSVSVDATLKAAGGLYAELYQTQFAGQDERRATATT